MKKIKNLVICILALALVLSMAACGSSNDAPASSDNSVSSTPNTDTPSSTPEDKDEPAVPEFEPVENPVTYFSMYLSENIDSYKYLSAYPDGAGNAYIEYEGDGKKIGTLEEAALHGITAALNATGLAALNGQSEYAEGEAMCSMYIEFADGTYLTADFSGAIPEEFISGYEAMDRYFLEITANMAEYVPQAQVMGEVNADVLAAMQDILNNSGMEGLDMLAISDIPLDEYFAFSAGLSSAEGIANGTTCSAMMMTTPYSLVIVTAEDANSIEAIRADFESSLDWQKWVCVIPSNALIADMGNMVLCLMGSDAMFAQTAASIEAAGWSNIVTIDNPDM